MLFVHFLRILLVRVLKPPFHRRILVSERPRTAESSRSANTFLNILACLYTIADASQKHRQRLYKHATVSRRPTKISFCMKFSWRASQTKNVGETHKNNRRKFTDTSVKCRIPIAHSSPKSQRHFDCYFTRRSFSENLPHCRRPFNAASAIIPSPLGETSRTARPSASGNWSWYKKRGVVDLSSQFLPRRWPLLFASSFAQRRYYLISPSRRPSRTSSQIQNSPRRRIATPCHRRSVRWRRI